MNENSEYTHLWRPKDLEGLDLFDALINERKFPKHIHDNYTICVTEKGIGEVYYQGKLLKADSEHIILINPEEVHAGWALRGHSWKYKVMYIDRKLMQRVLAEGTLFTKEIFKHPKLIKDFCETFDYFLKDVPQKVREGEVLRFLESLVEVTTHKSDKVKAQGKERLTIKAVKDYLREHYGENISISELAGMVGLSANYLIRTFRKAVGLPPHAYQMQVRIQEAKKALLSCKPIAQVALEAGFFDQSHLNRCFKRILGVTPKQYRSWATSLTKV